MHQAVLPPALHPDKNAKRPDGLHGGRQDGALLGRALPAAVTASGAPGAACLPVVRVQVLASLLRDGLQVRAAGCRPLRHPQPSEGGDEAGLPGRTTMLQL